MNPTTPPPAPDGATPPVVATTRSAATYEPDRDPKEWLVVVLFAFGAVGFVILCHFQPWILNALILLAFVVGTVVVIVAAVAGSGSADRARSKPVRRAFLTGLLIGWWLGDDDADCDR